MKMWSLGALMLLGSPVATLAQQFPWRSGDAPPAVVGLRLGDNRARIDSVLGTPASVQSLGEGANALDFPDAGVVVIWTAADGVAVIDLRSPAAGAIGKVRVGASIDTVLKAWGPPQTAEAGVGLYIVDWWVVVVRASDDGKRVAMLSIGRVAG